MRRILQESAEALDVERSLIPASAIDAGLDVHDLVLQKLMEFKGKKKSIKTNVIVHDKSDSYSPLDLLDWTARSIG